MKSKEEIEKLTDKWYTEKNQMIPSIIEQKSFINGYTQCQNDMLHDQTVTRFEVIDENGRAYTQRDCNVELSYQDDGKTLKVFIKPNKQD